MKECNHCSDRATWTVEYLGQKMLCGKCKEKWRQAGELLNIELVFTQTREAQLRDIATVLISQSAYIRAAEILEEIADEM